MSYRTPTLLLAIVAASLPASAAPDLSKLPPVAPQQGVTYGKDIRPLFEASCFGCHGEQKPKAGLRLDSLESVVKGSKDGKVILPGQSDKSKLVIAVARLDNESAMPPRPRQGKRRNPQDPAKSNPDATVEKSTGPGAPDAAKQPMRPPPKPLTPEQVGLIRAWVDQGAK